MKEAPVQNCPKCGTDLSEAHKLLEERVLAFCPQCKFPLVLVAGKYRLEKELGQGGYGVVYKARHIYLDSDSLRVVKILKSDVFQIPGMEQRFYREVQVTSVLSQKDEHIIRIYDDFGKIPSVGPFYVMEFLEGLRLDALLVQSTHLPGLPFVMHIFRQLSRSIQFAHDAGVVHRDLKPENLYLVERRGDNYFLKIIDFGIAKPINQQELKMTQGVLGSPFYMSPEQCLNQDVDHRADIYAMGCILFELLTGYPPFHPKLGNTQASSLVELLGAHVAKPPPSPRLLRPERVSVAMEKVMLQALEKNPAHRFQSAQDMFFAMERTQAESSTAEYSSVAVSQPLVEVLPLEPNVLSYHETPPTADFPAIEGVSAQFDFPSSKIVLAGEGASASWDDISASDVVARSFFRTIQNTVRDEEGIRYYRVIFVLALFLMGGVAIGWWVFFFTHGPQGLAASPRRQIALEPRGDAGVSQTAEARRRTPPVALVKPRAPLVAERPAPRLVPERRRPQPVGRPVRVFAQKVRKRWMHPMRRRRHQRDIRRTRKRALPQRRPPMMRAVVAVAPLRRVALPPARRAVLHPIAGCPAKSPGIRWVRLNVRPSHIAATILIVQGVGQADRFPFGFCVGLRSSVHLRIDANEFRPCTIRLVHKHAQFAIRMKKDSTDSIEVEHDYCLR